MRRAQVGAWIVAGAMLSSWCDPSLDGYSTQWDAADVSSGDAGSDACTPQCSGRTCGDDGCGGQCGQCQGSQQCTKTGTCEDCDPNGWVYTMASLSTGFVFHDSQNASVWVAGTNLEPDGGTQETFIQPIDSCTGAPGALMISPKAGGRTLPAVQDVSGVPGSDHFFISGGYPSPTYSRFDTASASLAYVADLPFSTTTANVYDISAATNGVWLAGWDDPPVDSGVSLVPKLYFGPQDGTNVCSHTLDGYPNPTWGRAVAVSGNDLYLVSSGGTTTYVDHFDASCVTDCAKCSPTASWPPLPETLPFILDHAVIVGSTLVATGFEGTSVQAQLGSGDWEALLVQFDLGSHTWMPSIRLNGTAAPDGFSTVATDGTKLYVGYTTGASWQPNPSTSVFETGAAQIVVFDTVPVPANSQPSATIALPGSPAPPSHWVDSILVDATGLYVATRANASDTDTVVARCSFTACP